MLDGMSQSVDGIRLQPWFEMDSYRSKMARTVRPEMRVHIVLVNLCASMYRYIYIYNFDIIYRNKQMLPYSKGNIGPNTFL